VVGGGCGSFLIFLPLRVVGGGCGRINIFTSKGGREGLR